MLFVGKTIACDASVVCSIGDGAYVGGGTLIHCFGFLTIKLEAKAFEKSCNFVYAKL